MSLKPEDIPAPSRKWSSSEPWSNAKHDTPGAYPPSPIMQVEHDMAEQPSIAAAVKARRAEYTRKKSLKIKVGSWNVAATSGTEKDLAGWFIKGYGIKGLSNDLSDLSVDDPSSSDENMESVEEQENRRKKKKCTLPKHDTAGVASEDEVGLYVLGLQEVVDITSVTEALRPYYDPNAAKKWKHALKKALPAGYKKVAELQLLGLLILVYAASDIAEDITSVDAQSVGTGALGYVGNKGAVSVRIMLGSLTRMVFVNSHLAAGADQAALTRRLWDTSQILTRTKFQPANYDGDVIEGLQEEIGDEDFAFWFGDLNYRLDGIPGEDVRRLLLLHTRNEYDVINKSRRRIDSELGYMEAPSTDSLPDPEHYEYADIERVASDSTAEPALDPEHDPASLITTIKSLLAHDQLYAQQRLGKAFHEGWREGNINFLPTYKYDIGSVGMFDSGEKKRSPSWCDRILFRTRRDKQAFDARVRREADAHKRDEDMKARGLDKDAAEQEVLFDYNPATDGTDDYDEYDDAVDDVADTQSVKTVEGAEDTIQLEDYISHQRVLSSDHKPLSAVFSLTYDAVIPELKSKVHQDVTRSFDKNENETRPSLTVVVDNPLSSSAHADHTTGATELNAIEFADVRYRAPQTRAVTLANTSLIPTTFAFINRPTDPQQETGLAPSWVTIHVNAEGDAKVKDKEQLGQSTPFTLQPGDVIIVEITVNVVDHDFVHRLNSGIATLDEILVLRVLNGRDHFLRVCGSWFQTCFCRTLDELVRIPSGVRNQQPKSSVDEAESLRRTSSLYHSAPTELFTLTEALPAMLERAVPDWTMLHADEEPPWKVDPMWPFVARVREETEEDEYSMQLATVREALDTATPIDQHLDVSMLPLERAELIADTLLSFLQSLRDGIISPQIFLTMEARLDDLDKDKSGDHLGVHEMVMDVMSAHPVHSVSFTFITYMLTRMITELSTIEALDAVASPTSPQSPQTIRSHRLERSSTQESEAPSTISHESVESVTKSPRSKFGFLTSLPRRGTGLLSSATTPTTPKTPSDGRKLYTTAYVERLAPIVIRSSQDAAAKGKEKKSLDAKKRRILEALLDVDLA